MSDEKNRANSTGHGGFELRDIEISGVIYFLLFLAVMCIVAGFLVSALFHYLERRTEAEQPPVSPLVTNAPQDTRKLPVSYQDYLKQNFPSPQLEINERDQLNKIRTEEDQTLETYGWVDQKAGTVRIPIDRAMDLIAQRGLPVRSQDTGAQASAAGHSESNKNKGTKQ